MDLSSVMKLIIASSKTLKDRVHGHNTFSFLMQLTSLSVLRIKIAQVVLMLTYMYMHVDIDLFTTDETKIGHIDSQWHLSGLLQYISPFISYTILFCIHLFKMVVDTGRRELSGDLTTHYNIQISHFCTCRHVDMHNIPSQ